MLGSWPLFKIVSSHINDIIQAYILTAAGPFGYTGTWLNGPVPLGKTVMAKAIEIVGWVCVIGLAILSMVANFSYGLLAASGPERWIYALAGAFLDGLKTVLPVVIATLLAGRITAGTFFRALFATVLFLSIGTWSLTCALGLYAVAKSEKVSGAALSRKFTEH